MKYLIASDIHGSKFYAEKIVKAFENEKADRLILLGDIFNHGPRNPLPKEYAPIEVAEILNGLCDKLIVIKGNCDSEVDTLISNFDFVPYVEIVNECKVVGLTHGHVYNMDNPPKNKIDALVYGHFHTGFLKEKNGVVFANAGSVSLPKDNTPHSYIIFDKDQLQLKDIDGKILDTIRI